MSHSPSLSSSVPCNLVFSSVSSSSSLCSAPIPPYFLFDYESLHNPLESFATAIRNTQKHLAASFASSKSLVTLAALEKSQDRAKLLENLKNLRAKLVESSQLAEKYAKSVEIRLEVGESRLKEFEIEKVRKCSEGQSQTSAQATWNTQKLDTAISPPSPIPSYSPQRLRYYRVLFDCLLRYQRFATVQSLIKFTPAFRAFLDFESFLSAKKGSESFDSQQLTKALQWCGENRSRLNKSRIPMEFQLKMQEMIQLNGQISYETKHTEAAQNGNRNGAETTSNDVSVWKSVEFARKHLSPFLLEDSLLSPDDWKEFQRIFASLLANNYQFKARNEGDEVEVAEAAIGNDGETGVNRGVKRGAGEMENRGRTEQISDDQEEAEEEVDEEDSIQDDESSMKDEDEEKSEPESPCLSGPKLLESRYSAYYSPCRWTKLKENFKESHLRLTGLSNTSFLERVIYCGLAAIRSPHCGSKELEMELEKLGKPTECPACAPIVKELTAEDQPIPMANRSGSVLICRLSGSVMGPENPPVVTPHNQIYSQSALSELAKRDRSGLIKCPITGQSFALKDCKPVYVL